MRITEVQESRHIDDYAEFRDVDEDEEDYYTEDEFEETPVSNGSKSLRGHVTNVIQAFTPSRIRHTLQNTSLNMVEQTKSLGRTAGNLAWIFTTSMLLVGLPVLYAYDREKNTAMQAGQMAPLDAQ